VVLTFNDLQPGVRTPLRRTLLFGRPPVSHSLSQRVVHEWVIESVREGRESGRSVILPTMLTCRVGPAQVTQYPSSTDL
jgi:hypothetical protein